MVNRYFCIAVFFLASFSVLIGQETASENVPVETANPELEAVLDYALSSAERGEWDNALEALKEAERIAPDSEKVRSYYKSIMELKFLDEAQLSWEKGKAAEVKEEKNNRISDNGEPKFTIDRGEKDITDKPENHRDSLRAETSFKLFAHNPINNSYENTWRSSDEFFSSAFTADAHYWFPFAGKILGVNFRNNGYSYATSSENTIFNTVDLGANLRGFLFENTVSRMEMGLDIGIAFQNDSTTPAFFLGFSIYDPLFFHLFKIKAMEPLRMGSGIRIYSTNTADLMERVNYFIDASWYFKYIYTGARAEWWGFYNEDNERTNIFSFSVFAGYRF